MDEIKVEFDCQMKTSEDLQQVKKSLKKINYLDSVNFDLDKKSLTFKITPNFIQTGKGLDEIQKQIEKDTGLPTILKGFGNTLSAVSEIHSDYSNIKNLDYSVKKIQPVIGVVRLTQLLNKRCFIDAVIDNLDQIKQCPFSVTINEFGDLSGHKFENTGDIKIRLIDNLSPGQNSSSTRFKRIVDNCDLNDSIGRSVIINGHNKKPIAGGIIARASPVSGNDKKICLCSGKTIWTERKENQVSH